MTINRLLIIFDVLNESPRACWLNPVLNENKLLPQETFFIDDTEENTRTADKLGIKVWNINPTSEDVVDLLARKEFNSWFIYLSVFVFQVFYLSFLNYLMF